MTKRNHTSSNGTIFTGVTDHPDGTSHIERIDFSTAFSDIFKTFHNAVQYRDGTRTVDRVDFRDGSSQTDVRFDKQGNVIAAGNTSCPMALCSPTICGGDQR